MATPSLRGKILYSMDRRVQSRKGGGNPRRGGPKIHYPEKGLSVSKKEKLPRGEANNSNHRRGGGAKVY